MVTVKCAQCGHDMDTTTGMYRYGESGLNYVTLMNIPMYRCKSCDETEVVIPGMEELHCLIGLLLIHLPIGLGAAEVKYLRKHMGYTQEELASYLGVTRASIARWEEPRGTLRADQDKSLRLLYVRKKGDDFEEIGIDTKRLLEVVLERLPLPPKKRQQLRIRTEDWIKKQGKPSCPSA